MAGDIILKGRIVADEEIHLNQDEARGGTTPKMTRYILGISLPLVIVAFLIILYIWS